MHRGLLEKHNWPNMRSMGGKFSEESHINYEYNLVVDRSTGHHFKCHDSSSPPIWKENKCDTIFHHKFGIVGYHLSYHMSHVSHDQLQ